MKDIFGDDKKNTKKYDSGVEEGNFEDMLKLRDKQLPKIEESIRDALKDYHGQNICILVGEEDENGYPSGTHVVMAGVGRMESQLYMARALSHASDQSLEILQDSAKGDVKAMLQVAKAMVNMIELDEKPKGKKSK